MNIVIRKANINDLDKIINLKDQVHKLHVKWRPDIFVMESDMINKEILEELISADSIFVAENEINVVVGYMIAIIKPERKSIGTVSRKYLSIEVIVVDESYRRKGIGTEFLKFSEKLAKEANCTDLYLTVNEENKEGINNYEKFGFKVKNIAYSKKL